MRGAWARAIGRGVIVVLMACSDPVIQMELAPPDPAASQGFDLTCVGAVRIAVIGNGSDAARDAEVVNTCFDFPGAVHDFRDVVTGLERKFMFDLPRGGLAGVQLAAFSGRCADPITSFESVFYGGAPSGQGSKLVIPLRMGVSCGTQQTYNVHTIDLTSLYLPSGATCALPSDSVKLFAGVIRPRMLGPRAPRMLFEYGVDSQETGDGTGKLQSFLPTNADPACVALGYRGTSSGGMTCVRPPAQAHGLCGKANEVEIIAVPVSDAVTVIDPMLSTAYGDPVFGAVLEAETRTPISNATIELADPSQGKVVYTDLGIAAGSSPPRLRRMSPVVGATSTTAGGGFMVYLRGEATNLVVTAPDHVAQTLRVASAPDQLSTLVVALARQ